jgi:hypothetical protein
VQRGGALSGRGRALLWAWICAPEWRGEWICAILCSSHASVFRFAQTGGVRGDLGRTWVAELCFAGLAQLVVHLICNQGVGGSNPSAGTKSPRKINHLRAASETVPTLS